MLRIRTTSRTPSRVMLTVEGNLCDAQLAPLRKAITEARHHSRQVRLDLEAVELVGRRTLRYLVETIGPDVRIERCPAYLARWMACERANPVPHDDGAAARSRAGIVVVPRRAAHLRQTRRRTP